MNRFRPVFLVIILIFTIACATPTLGPRSSPTSPPPPTLQPSFTPPPTIPPLPTPTPGPTDIPLPADPYTPVAILVDQPESTGRLSLLDMKGNPFAQLELPGLQRASIQAIHPAARFNPKNISNLPLIYLTSGTPPALTYLTNQPKILLNVPGAYGLVGAPRSPVVAYSQSSTIGKSITSSVFAGGPDTLTDNIPYATLIDPEGKWQLIPLSVAASGERASRIWYTQKAVPTQTVTVFDTHRYLYEIDIRGNRKQTLLEENANPWSLSPNLEWVAYSTPTSGERLYNTLRLLNLTTKASQEIAAQPESNLGAGDAVISPNNRLVAWKEGSLKPPASTPQIRIRMSTFDGASIIDFTDQAIAQALGWTNVNRLTLPGWLDPGTLLVEANSTNQTALLTISFAERSVNILRPGATFIAFIYP
ncbi:MAG TPA: hypothetical protein VIO61_15005 [Anaerolineaceae bacterium]